MRTKCIAVLIAFCTLIALASAQIDNCCFVDRQCGSDQEWTNGYWAFQNGQCAAPAPSGQPANSSTPVDNCCGIDRQCSTDLEWMAGWQAYRNGQCAAPAPSGQPANSSAPVDNCCGIDRQCSTDAEWTAGWQAYRNGQCIVYAQRVVSAPATGGNCCSLGWYCLYEEERVQGYWAYQINQCAGLPQTSAVTLTGPVPRIEGSSRFVGHITATLKFIKSVAPDWYNYVITGMDSIVEVPVPGWKPGDVCTALAYSRERRVTLESCWIDSSQRSIGVSHPYFDQRDTAAALGHEACHIHTHEEGKYFATQDDEEAECRKFGGGAFVLIYSALALVSPRGFGTSYFPKEEAISLFRQHCSEGYRADLFCPTLQRLEDIWRNVPYPIFPPGAPEW